MRSFGIIFNGRKGGLTCLSLTTLVPIHFEWALGLMVHCSLKNAQLNYQLFSFKFNSEFLDNKIMTENTLLGSIALSTALLIYILHLCFINLINIFSASQSNHTTQRKVDFKEFVQNSLCCDMGLIIFDLHGYGGC